MNKIAAFWLRLTLILLSLQIGLMVYAVLPFFNGEALGIPEILLYLVYHPLASGVLMAGILLICITGISGLVPGPAARLLLLGTGGLLTLIFDRFPLIFGIPEQILQTIPTEMSARVTQIWPFIPSVMLLITCFLTFLPEKKKVSEDEETLAAFAPYLVTGWSLALLTGGIILVILSLFVSTDLTNGFKARAPAGTFIPRIFPADLTQYIIPTAIKNPKTGKPMVVISYNRIPGEDYPPDQPVRSLFISEEAASPPPAGNPEGTVVSDIPLAGNTSARLTYANDYSTLAFWTKNNVRITVSGNNLTDEEMAQVARSME
jgi:hypothetical protein